MLFPEFAALMQRIYNNPKFDKRRDINWFDNALCSSVRLAVGESCWQHDVDRAEETLEELGEEYAPVRAEAVSATETSEAKLREALVKLDAETYQHVEGWHRTDTGSRVFVRRLTDAVDEEGEHCGPWLRVKNEYAGCWAWSFYLDYVHRSHAHGQQSNAWDAMVAAEAAYARWKAEQ